jgi:hypothetical protein
MQWHYIVSLWTWTRAYEHQRELVNMMEFFLASFDDMDALQQKVSLYAKWFH